MMQFFQRILDWFKSLFWKEEMELTLVGLQYSGKTTFVNVIAVSASQSMEADDNSLRQLWQLGFAAIHSPKAFCVNGWL